LTTFLLLSLYYEHLIQHTSQEIIIIKNEDESTTLHLLRVCDCFRVSDFRYFWLLIVSFLLFRIQYIYSIRYNVILGKNNISIVKYILVRLTTVELGAQLLSSYDLINDHIINQTDLQQSLTPNNGYLNLRENQLIRLTCIVSRALPAAILHFPFDIDYRVERNSTIENDDKTYQSILVLILRINRFLHKRIFHCQATQLEIVNNEYKQDKYLRILSNTLQIDVACKYRNNDFYRHI
jgi:hypothetical protein